jgi:hypothetical protein
MRLYGICGLLLLAGGVAAASESGELRKAPVGTRFTTSKGVSFTLLFRSESGREAWRDEKSGVIWGDRLSRRVPRKEAAALCASSIANENVVNGKHLDALPTLDDFALAESHGFREVLPNMKDDYFWAASSVPGAANVGHVFSAGLGRPILILYRSINFDHVRCILRGQRPRSSPTPKNRK